MARMSDDVIEVDAAGSTLEDAAEDAVAAGLDAPQTLVEIAERETAAERLLGEEPSPDRLREELPGLLRSLGDAIVKDGTRLDNEGPALARLLVAAAELIETHAKRGGRPSTSVEQRQQAELRLSQRDAILATLQAAHRDVAPELIDEDALMRAMAWPAAAFRRTEQGEAPAWSGFGFESANPRALRPARLIVRELSAYRSEAPMQGRLPLAKRADLIACALWAETDTFGYDDADREIRRLRAQIRAADNPPSD